MPRGATRRLYTAPHSLLDTSPAQHPRQLLNTVASTNVLVERARVSPVSSTASSHSSGSVKAGDHQNRAAPALQLAARSPGTVAAAATASSWRPFGTSQALNHDLIGSRDDSPTQLPASAGPSMPASHTTHPMTAGSASSSPRTNSLPCYEPLPAQRGLQKQGPETGSAQQTNPEPGFTAHAHFLANPSPVAGNQSGGPGIDRHTGSASSPHSSFAPNGWSQNSQRTAGGVSRLPTGAQQSHAWQAPDTASSPSQVITVQPK